MKILKVLILFILYAQGAFTQYSYIPVSVPMRDGKYLENVGTYDSLQDPVQVTLKSERIRYWMDQGAKPSDTVRSLLKKEGFFSSAN